MHISVIQFKKIPHANRRNSHKLHVSKSQKIRFIVEAFLLLNYNLKQGKFLGNVKVNKKISYGNFHYLNPMILKFAF